MRTLAIRVLSMTLPAWICSGSTCPENITKPNTYLMIEAMRRLEEEDKKTPPPKALAVPRLSIPNLDTLPDAAIPIEDVTPAPIIEPPSARKMVAPESGPSVAPIVPNYSDLADDLVLPPPGPPVDLPPDHTPVGAELAEERDELAGRRLGARLA